MTTPEPPPSRTNVPGVISMFLGLIGAGLFFGLTYPLPTFLVLLLGLLIGIVAVGRAGKEKVTGILGIVFSGAPLALGIVTFVAQMSRG